MSKLITIAFLFLCFTSHAQSKKPCDCGYYLIGYSLSMDNGSVNGSICFDTKRSTDKPKPGYSFSREPTFDFIKNIIKDEFKKSNPDATVTEIVVLAITKLTKEQFDSFDKESHK